MSPLGMTGGYQETTRESFVTSDSVGQSGGETAECGIEGKGSMWKGIIHYCKVNRTIYIRIEL